MAASVKAFATELKALMKKYNARLGVSASNDSDWHGIRDEEVFASVDGRSMTLGEGLIIDSSDIKLNGRIKH